MCNATGGGCEPAARAVTTNVTDDGSLYGSSEALALKPGTRYYSTVAATGCGGVTARSRSETGVVCDESPPVVLGLPTIRSVGDTAALPLPGRAVVKWAGVFSDDESGVRSYEVCVAPAGGSCRQWQSAGSNSEAEVSVDVSGGFASGQQVVAVVRATNRAGHASEVSSNVISLDGEPPELLSMGVEGLLDDTATALDQCLLSGDGAVRVTWRKGAAVDTTLSHFTVQAFDATTYLPATAEVVVDGHTGEGLCPGVCTQNVFNGQPEPCYADPACLDENNAGYNGGLGCNAGGKGQLCRFCGFTNQAGEVYPACPTTDAAFVDVFAAEGTRLRFVVGAVDSAGLRAERSLVCLVDRSPPAAGYVTVPSGFTLGADTYAHDVAAPLKMCFNGFIDMHAGVKTIEYEVLMRNMTAARRLSEGGDCEGVAISRRVVDVALAGYCVNA